MYNKRGHVNLETSASFHNRLDTNLAFFSTDLGTADLVFNITRNKSPLLVSEENAATLLVLMKNDEYIVQEVEYIDPMNGQLKSTIDDRVLARPGKWRGQIYIEVHDSGNPAKEDIVTQAEFTFDIKDSVINTIPAIDKLNEIRTFIDFREEIMETISEINTALENGEDYVSQMEATKASGMKALNDRSAQVINEIKALVDNHKQELNDLKDNNITELDNKANQIKADIEQLNQYDTSNWQKAKLTNDDGRLKQLSGFDFDNPELLLGEKSQFIYVSQSFNRPVGSNINGTVMYLVVTSAYKRIEYRPNGTNKIFYRSKEAGVWLDWKELTNDNTRQWLGTLGEETSGYNSVLDLPPGFYEAAIPSDAWTVDAPQSMNGSDYIAAIDVYEGNSKRKQIRLVQNQYNYEFLATVHTENVDNPNGRFMGWKRVMNAEEFEAKNNDTGWINWEVMNDAVPLGIDQETSIRNQYRVITTNGVKKCYLRVYVNNITTQMTIGSIPKEHVPKVQHFYVRTPVTMNPAVLVVDVDGQLKVYLNTNDTAKWQPGHYIIGEVSWIIDDVGAGI